MKANKMIKGIIYALTYIVAFCCVVIATLVSAMANMVSHYKSKERVYRAIRKARKMDYCCTYRCCGSIGYCRGRVLQMLSSEQDKKQFELLEQEHLKRLIK
jgi:hypothetical protein